MGATDVKQWLEVDEARRAYWPTITLRPLQQQAIEANLSGRDSLVVLPTGGGKSLCYQLPAVARKTGLTVVVTPLIALMKDQVDSLCRLGIPATFLNSTQHPHDQAELEKRLIAGEFRLLYVSPERLMSPECLTLLTSSLRPGACPDEIGIPSSLPFVIDEAHCIAEWGHDFRPAYRALGNLRKVFPDVPIHAFTATATRDVRKEIEESLNLRDPIEEIIGDFDRPNLHLYVQPRGWLMGQLLEFIRHHAGDGIIYCPTRARTEQVAHGLRHAGIHAMEYHAGLSDERRREIQDWFVIGSPEIFVPSSLSPSVPPAQRIVVATIAFGMGINKPGVRWIVHVCMPSSMEVYHQEIGRAGRDGAPADCMILYDPGDLERWKELFLAEDDLSTADSKYRKAEEMAIYCEETECRHRQLVYYFDEAQSHTVACGLAEPACDVCIQNRNSYGADMR